MKQLDSRGFAHHFLLALIVIGVAVGGSYYVVATKASSFDTNDGGCARPSSNTEITAANERLQKGEAAGAFKADSEESTNCYGKALEVSRTVAAEQQSVAEASAVSSANLAEKCKDVVSAGKKICDKRVSKVAAYGSGLTCSVSGIPRQFPAGKDMTATVKVKNTSTVNVAGLILEQESRGEDARNDKLYKSKSVSIKDLAPGEELTRQVNFNPAKHFAYATDSYTANDDIIFKNTQGTVNYDVYSYSSRSECGTTQPFTATLPTENTKISLSINDWHRSMFTDFPVVVANDRGKDALVAKTKGTGLITQWSWLQYGTSRSSGYTKDQAFLRQYIDKRVKICMTARTDAPNGKILLTSGKSFKKMISLSNDYKEHCYTTEAKDAVRDSFLDPVTVWSRGWSSATDYTINNYIKSVTIEKV